MIVDGKITGRSMFYAKRLVEPTCHDMTYDALVFDEPTEERNPSVVEVLISDNGNLYMGLIESMSGITVTQEQAGELVELLRYFEATGQLPYGAEYKKETEKPSDYAKFSSADLTNLLWVIQDKEAPECVLLRSTITDELNRRVLNDR